jgi:glycosyltransferase involved in cell wall biosynthesis
MDHLARQQLRNDGVPFEVILVDNNCTDEFGVVSEKKEA